MDRRKFLQSAVATLALTTGLARAKLELIDDSPRQLYLVAGAYYKRGNQGYADTFTAVELQQGPVLKAPKAESYVRGYPNRGYLRSTDADVEGEAWAFPINAEQYPVGIGEVVKLNIDKW